MGRLVSAILVCVITLLAALALWGGSRIGWYADLDGIGLLSVQAGIVGMMALLVLLPAGVVFDRAVRRIEALLGAASSEDGTEIPVTKSPRFIARLVGAFEQTVLAMRSREREATARVRDMAVQHRVLETERDQLAGVLNALQDAVIVTDAFDEIIVLNEAAGRVLGVEPGAAQRKPIDAVMTDRRLAALVREARLAANIREARTVEHDVQRNGASIGFQVTLSCLQNLKGQVGAVVTILHDLTREREIAQMKSDFVSKASHELRTPLSSIRAYVEMLVDGEANDEAVRSEFYTIIQNETERLSRLIDNMLNISRIEAGIIQIDREQVDFRQLLQRASDSLEPQAREKDMAITVKAAPVDLTAEGDSDMLYQVVLNLVSNAIKYTPNGGRITVAADSDNLTRSIVVTVSDTGLGIPPDALPRLFEKFYRIENFKRVAKGTGLGLNLCKHIIETVHQGQVGVESKLGMGSRFWFSIPMKFAVAQAA